MEYLMMTLFFKANNCSRYYGLHLTQLFQRSLFIWDFPVLSSAFSTGNPLFLWKNFIKQTCWSYSIRVINIAAFDDFLKINGCL